MGSLMRWGWEQFNSANQVVFGAGEYGFLFVVVVLHVILAVATLGLGDQTICEILRPLKKIFSIDQDSLLEGALDVGLALPRAVIYCLRIYLRAYLLALRLFFGAYFAIMASLLSVLALMLVFLVLFGESEQTLTPGQSQVGELLLFFLWAYWYWRIDGRRIAGNLIQSWRCMGQN